MESRSSRGVDMKCLGLGLALLMVTGGVSLFSWQDKSDFEDEQQYRKRMHEFDTFSGETSCEKKTRGFGFV